MELQQLKYFREVAEREHVTRAAEKLFVSQSAISRAVTQLEEELGVPLFYRQGRAVVLSPYGRVFLEYVTRALSVLKARSGCSANRPGRNPEPYRLAFYTHSELKWFRDLSKSIAGSIPGFNSRCSSSVQERC